MIPFYSKRNQVYPVLWHHQAAVEKHFIQLSDWQQEVSLYAALKNILPLPTVFDTSPGTLITEYLPHSTLLAELERQETVGFTPISWQALAAWLRSCHAACGQLPREGNLRNFLWDAANGQIIGLDLESFLPSTLEECGARLIATLLDYTPADSSVKQQVARLLLSSLHIPESAIQAERQALHIRRQKHEARPMSGIILAGGASKRMGQNKAELSLLDKPLLLWQIEKMNALGIQDILLSGANCPSLPGTRIIPDLYPCRGPLGGLHACLQAAEHPHCLVLSVDVPLVPLSALNHLCRTHTSGVTILRHHSGQEPLIGVYDSALSNTIVPLIREGSAPVQALRNNAPWHFWDYLGPEEFLLNCNTPQVFSSVEAITKQYQHTFSLL